MLDHRLVELKARLILESAHPPFVLSPRGTMLFTRDGKLLFEFRNANEAERLMLALTLEMVEFQLESGRA